MGEWRDAGGNICTGTAYTGYREKRRKSNQTQGKAREATWRCLNLKTSCNYQTEGSREEAETFVQKRKRALCT